MQPVARPYRLHEYEQWLGPIDCMTEKSWIKVLFADLLLDKNTAE
jgi:hypothetical protein